MPSILKRAIPSGVRFAGKVLLAVLSGFPLAATGLPRMDWHWSNPLPSGNDLIHVAFHAPLRGLIVADNGDVSETDDGGETWKSRGGHIENDYLVSAAALDSRTIVSLSGSGRIWRTTDRGATWSVAAAFRKTLLKIRSCGDGIMLAVGMDGSTIVRSADRGATWKEVHGNVNGPYLAGLHCADGPAFAVGDSGTVLRSRDKGMHWESMPNTLPGTLTAVAFSDSSHGMVTNNRGRIATTSDGGSNWKVTLLDSNHYLTGVYRKGSRWLVVGSGGGIWTSGDDGASWARSDSLTALSLASAAFIDDSAGIAIGNNGIILKEYGRPGSWKAIRSGMDRHVDGMAVLSPASWLSFGYPGAILKTNDAGTTWMAPAGHPDTTRFLGGAFHGRRGLLCGFGGAIAVSRDGGSHWQEAGTPGKALRLFGIAWSDSMTAVAVGDSAALWRTVDGGGTWTESPRPPGVGDQTLSAVSFRSDGVGIIVGYAGRILRSTDQGASWTVIPSPVPERLYAFSFRDASFGLAVGRRGVVLSTRDGGASWARHSQGSEVDHIYGIAWLRGDTALSIGGRSHGGFLALTTDAGATWTDLPLPTRKPLWGLAALGPGRAAITGQDGAILIGTLNRGDSGKGDPALTAEEAFFSVQRTGTPGQVLMQVSLATAQKVTVKAFATDGRFLGNPYQGALEAGSHALRFRFARRGPTLFRMEGIGSQSRVSRTKLLPF